VEITPKGQISQNGTGKPQQKLSADQKRVILETLAAVATVLGQDIPHARMDLLLQMVQDLPFDALKEAIESWPLEHEWFLKPVELRRLCGATRETTQERRAIQAEAAWDRVSSNCLRAASMDWGDSPLLDDYYRDKMRERMAGLSEVEQYALRQVGWWQGISRTRPENIGFVRDRFIDAYTRFCETQGQDVAWVVPGIGARAPGRCA